jgi:hypothetical protein
MKQNAVEIFLRLFGCSKILFAPSSPSRLCGRVAWDDEPEDFQEFAVDTSQRPLTEDSLALAEFLHARILVDTDRIAVPRRELLEMFSLAGHNDWTPDRLNAALDDLEEFCVHMVDDGEETDVFFLHE